MSAVIKVENVSKQYRLGKVGTGTISHDLNRWWHQIRGKEDPYLKIGELNDRSLKGKSDYVWALKNINFEINEGDAVGIIGRNGAGKSTLLKILSRTTTPTTGSLRLRGRVASLLEVGTGFHPELSGRENIYLNGAILGMSRKEIARKFDEIVDFSGVERYIDTPVKRYSSGMYVRLAFAVAAHLESEILIVDEVLAVGDAEFQKKCLGKMGDVSKGEGRTVLFVSHNLAAIKALCNNSILLKNGEFQFQGISDEAVRLYLKNTETLESNLMNRKDREGNGKVIVSGITLKNDRDEPVSNIMSGDFLSIEVDLYTRQDTDFSKLIVACSLSDPYQMKVVSWVSDEMKVVFHSDMKPRFSLLVPKLNLRPGVYDINIQLSLGTTSPEDISDVILSASQITVVDSDYFLRGKMIRSGHMAILDGQYAL